MRVDVSNRVLVVAGVVCAMWAGWSLARAQPEGDKGGGGAAETGKTELIAVVKLGEVMEKMQETDRFKGPRETKRADFDAEYKKAWEEVDATRKKLEGIEQENPEYDGLYTSYREAYDKFEEVRERISKEFTKWSLEQSREVYKIVTDAAAQVAEQRGFKYLVASASLDTDKLDMEDRWRFANQLLARPVLHSPEGADITEDVLDDLNL
ncbi:MAG: OmpH family outer membrane protein [Phycisphaerales bacterium]